MKKLSETEIVKRLKAIHGELYDYSFIKYVNAKTPITIICPDHGEFKQLLFNHLNGQGCPKCSGQFPYTTQTFIEKAIFLHNNIYSYLKTIYVNTYTKIIITCPEHGDFEQSPFAHLQGQGCPKCGDKNKGLYLLSNIKEFIEKANKVHRNIFDYSLFNYINNYTKGIIICKKHGNFLQEPSSHLSGRGCPICKFSKGENIIKKILDKYNIQSKPQYRIPDEKFLFKYDFYLPELNILIEFHGRQHYEWIPYFHKTYHDFEEQCKRDSNKIDLAKMKNIPLIELNYQQLIELSEKEFEKLILFVINKQINRKVNHVI